MADQVTWTAPDGTVLDLTDTSSGYMVLGEGTSGLRSVSYEVSTQKLAGLDGELVQAIRATSSNPSLGLLVWADGEDDFRARARALRHAMRPQAGLGTLCVRNAAGEARNLDCYCTAGLEGDESDQAAVSGQWWKLALKLYAPTPWWYGDPQTLTYSLGSPTAFFPIFPTHLASSTVAGRFTIDLSDTDAPAYPVWTIKGPGSSLVLTNTTTGQVIQVNATLAAGESLVINTAPGQQSVRKGDGTNLMGSLASNPALWALIEGVNVVTCALTGATTASSIAATYAPRYAGV